MLPQIILPPKMTLFDILLYLMIIIVIVIIINMIRKKKEKFTIDYLLIPPLEEKDEEHYGYACPINGYNCEPTKLYKVNYVGKYQFRDIELCRYKMVDKEGIERYSGLYGVNSKLRIGSYVIFNNGQEYVVTSTNPYKIPSDCPTKRRKDLKE